MIENDRSWLKFEDKVFSCLKICIIDQLQAKHLVISVFILQVCKMYLLQTNRNRNS